MASDQPTLSDILIVGSSDTSHNFSETIQKTADIETVYHVDKTEDAAAILLQQKCGVIILDNDDEDVNPVTLSTIIRLNYPLARIIVISSSLSSNLVYDLINNGDVNAFIPIPIDDFTAYSVVLEQEAKFEIAIMLNQLILEPPKFTPAYYLLHDPSLSIYDKIDQLEFLGIVISYNSVTRFLEFKKDFHNVDQYLVSGYISAITLMGEQLFKNNELIEEINFGGVSVFFHFENELQFSIFFRSVTNRNVKEAENLVSKIKNAVLDHCDSILKGTGPIEENEHEFIQNIVELNLNIKDTFSVPLSSSGEKYKILIYGKLGKKVSSTLAIFEKDFEIITMNDEDKIMKSLPKLNPEVVIMNRIFDTRLRKFAFAARLKDASPRIQTIVLLSKKNFPQLIKILNSETIDHVITSSDKEPKIFSIVKNSALRSDHIKTHSNPQKLQLSYDQSTIARSLLRKEGPSYQRIMVPVLYGMFIVRDYFHFYSKFWGQDGERFRLDKNLFAGFISSLVTFSDETFKSQRDVFRGIKFGDANIITRHYYDYTFVYFVKMDSSNYQIVSKHVDIATMTLYDLIIQADTDEDDDWDERLLDKIEQVGVELFLNVTMMNPT